MNEKEIVETEVVETEAAEKNIPMEQFLTAVCEVKLAGGSAGDVADRLGITKDSVHTRMSQYRGKGIAVPEFAKGGGSRIKPDTANELIAKLMGEAPEVRKAKGATLAAEAAKRKAEREAAKAAETAAE